MRFKRKSDGATSTIIPQDGSLYVMRPPTNQLFKHSLPASKKNTGTRLSITFRNMHVHT